MKKALFRPLFPLLLLLLLAACQEGQPRRPDRLHFPPLAFHFPRVERLVLPNGIHLYLREDHELPLVRLTAMVGVGRIAEPADRSGELQLLAALLRSGGAGKRTPQQIDTLLDRLAAEFSVRSGTYTTRLDLSLRTADLAQGLGVLADTLRRPRLDPGRLELARRQLLEQLRRQDDDPGAMARRGLRRALYGDHPLGRTPTPATLGAVHRKDLRGVLGRYFHPNNLWLGVSGDFDRQRLLALLQRAFGNWPRQDFRPQPTPPIPAPAPATVWVADKPLPQTTILFGELGISKDNPDLYAVQVMNFLLGGGGFNSRFMREVRSNRGLAYAVWSVFRIGPRLPGLFLAGCETKGGSTLEVVRLLQQIMTQMRRQPVTAADLQLAKESLINSFVFAFTDAHAVVTRTMRLDFYHYPPHFLERYRDRVAAVSVQDVLRAAQRYLHPRRQVVVLVGDEGRFDAPPAALGLPVRALPRERDL